MSAIETAATVLHLLFAVLWVGAVGFVALAVLPLARDATLGPEPLERIVDRLLTLSRAAAVVVLATGLYVLYRDYLGDGLDPGPLVETGRGHLVLTMIVLWVALIGTLEVGSSRLLDGLDAGKHREPARDALRWYRASALVGVLVVVVGGLLIAGVSF